VADTAELKQDGGWEFSPRLPEWATADAVDRARRLLAEAAQANPEPLGPRPAEHALLRGIQIGGQLIRQSSVIGERAGLSFEAPYLDDRLLEAALSIRIEERFLSKVNKPVLAAAMRGVVPQEALDRRDKSNGDREMHDGIRRSRNRLEEALADPQLARMGLIDADAVRAVVLNLQTKVDRLNQLEPTWACEMWVRALLDAGQLTQAQPRRQPALAAR
jgi:asparagine synthase (glutamine-hydrolysing)